MCDPSRTEDWTPGESRRNEIRAGDRVDEFAINGLLGTGGCGVVLKARDTVTGRDVAIKTLRSPDVSRELQTTLINEARKAAKLDHEHIVKVFRVGVDESQDASFIVMQYVDGQDLAAIIDSEAPLPCLAAVDVVADVTVRFELRLWRACCA